MRGFHAWGRDYITYENTRVTNVPPAGEVGQVSLRYVNTDLATLLGAARGFFSGVLGSKEEPLPGIPPLDARLGLRFHDTSHRKEWNIEVTARMVARQDRVATSLLETTTSGFTVWDTRMLFRSRNIPSLSFATGVENMFNRRYREHFDFRTASGLSILQPGTNFHVSTSLSF